MVRVHLNDTQPGVTGTPGEGRIFVDTASFILPLLNEALLEFARDLENGGITTKRTVWFSSTTPVPPVHGPAGVGIPDPSIEEYLGFGGVFDGTTLNTGLKLPSDLVVPLALWQRTNGTGVPFTEVKPAQNGLVSAYQDATLGQWEWRGDAIWWNGATLAKDIKLRYTGGIPLFGAVAPSAFASTPLPLLDSQDALSYLMAYKFAAPRSVQGSVDELFKKYQMAVANLINRQTKMLQGVAYSRIPYGDAGEIADF